MAKAPKKTESPPAAGSNALARDELLQFIERIERLNAEKADIADQIKEVFAEAKGRGYDTKVMRRVISLRRRDKDEVAEEESILELYLSALGMSFAYDPFGSEGDDTDEMV